jgi:hypothetical protein
MEFLSYALSLVSAGLFMADGAPPQHSRYLVVGEGKFGADESVGFCGALVRAGKILSYFDRIRSDVRANDLRGLNQYYAGKVTIVYRHKKYNVAKSKVASSSLRLSLNDWKQIGALSQSKLGSGGDRGCFLSAGKAFFAVQNDGQLRLTAFDKDRPWSLR